jgi:hypothetical protein
MKIKMWSLVDKNSGKIVQIDAVSNFTDKICYAVGFATKKDLKEAVGSLDHSEKIVKIEMEI